MHNNIKPSPKDFNLSGGIAEYTGMDSTVVRILAVVIPGFGWVTYLICAIIMPEG